MTPLLYTVSQARAYLGGMGLTKIYEQMALGLLDVRKSGKRTLITAKSLEAYAENLPKATIALSSRQKEAQVAHTAADAAQEKSVPPAEAVGPAGRRRQRSRGSTTTDRAAA